MTLSFLGLQPRPFANRRVLYIIYYEEIPGYYKIGQTKALWGRLEEFSQATPYTPKVFAAIDSPDAGILERFLHAYYRPKRHKKEWFRLTAEDLTEIEAAINEACVPIKSVHAYITAEWCGK